MKLAIAVATGVAALGWIVFEAVSTRRSDKQDDASCKRRRPYERVRSRERLLKAAGWSSEAGNM